MQPIPLIILASDHAGYPHKQALHSWLESEGLQFVDIGCSNTTACNYATYAHALARKLLEVTQPAYGIAFCGTGQGMAITLNRHQHIRAALCWNKEVASLARAHNNANVCALPSRLVTPIQAIEIIQSFLTTSFEGGRHTDRINQINNYTKPISMTPQADIALIGLAVMGENLAINLANNGYTVAVYNRTYDKVETFLNTRAQNKPCLGAKSLAELVAQLKRPRKIIMLVKAGEAVDELINALIPHLEPGDILIDAGNTHFSDTMRRTKQVEDKGLLFVGAGISGGEEGALLGPSMMPGGSKEAWPHIKEIFQKIAAKVDNNEPCCNWIGDNGAGHFVKMAHNGIEYGDMQLIAEVYWIMKNILEMSHQEMHQTFNNWNRGRLKSYLIEITSEILIYQDADNTPLLEKIVDTAGQKGTGSWTGTAAMQLGVPLTLIAESVFARCLSAQKKVRQTLSQAIQPQTFIATTKINKEAFLLQLEAALYASKLVSYAQGFDLMQQAAKEYKWKLDYSNIALLWQGGCIIRSAFLKKIANAFKQNPQLENLLLNNFFKQQIEDAQLSWRYVCATAIYNGIPAPALTSALAYFDGLRSKNLPANLLQAQRDYFGAHNYERIDQPEGTFFHTNWTGRGNNTASSNYNRT